MKVILLIICILIIVYITITSIQERAFKEVNSQIEDANYWFDKKDYRRCIVILTRVIDKYPPNFSIYNNRGNAYYEIGEFDLAILDFQKSIDLMPDTNKNMKAFINLQKALSTKAFSDLTNVVN